MVRPEIHTPLVFNFFMRRVQLRKVYYCAAWPMENKKEISGIEIDIDSIADQNTRIIARHLLNIIELQAAEIVKLKDENSKLRDENNHLKGEQGKPTIRKQSKKGGNISSEEERKKRNQAKA